MDQVNLKIGRVGGLLPARLMRDTAVEPRHPADDRGQLGRGRRHRRGRPPRGGTPPDALFAVSFMNDWTVEHIAGYEPRSRGGLGPVPDGPGLGIDVDVAGLGAPLFSVLTPD